MSPAQAYYDNAAKMIITYVQPIITILGLLGNMLTFTIMQRKNMRSSSVAVYMSCLSFADSAVLILDFLNNWVKTVTAVRLVHMSDWFCRTYRFIFDISYSWASWLVVLVACERFIVVLFPFSAKTVCTVRNARISTVVSLLILFCLYTYNIVAWRLFEGECDIVPLHSYFMQNVAAWMSAVIYSYVPILVLIITNSAIVIRLVLSRKKRLALGEQEKEGVMSPETVRITITVVLICFFYIILTLPITSFYVIVFGAGILNSMGPEFAVIKSTILMFGLLNNGINFFLYTVSSQRYRTELKALLGLKKDGHSEKRDIEKDDHKTKKEYTSSKDTLSTGASGSAAGSNSELSCSQNAEVSSAEKF